MHGLSPSQNPFFRRGEVTLFTAWQGQRLVGRCSAQIDREHLRVHNDAAGFFGFFDTIDDREVAKALLDAAAAWLRPRGVIQQIYNDAWVGKWAYVPALPDEVRKMAEDLKLIIDPDIAFIAEVNGEPAGMCIMLPNLNEAIADLAGRLLPLGFMKALYRLKVKHPVSTRLMMLAIRDHIRKQRRYGGLSAAMYVETARRGLDKGYRWGELSWTREDDTPINVSIRSMGARVYKRAIASTDKACECAGC